MFPCRFTNLPFLLTFKESLIANASGNCGKEALISLIGWGFCDEGWGISPLQLCLLYHQSLQQQLSFSRIFGKPSAAEGHHACPER